MGDYLPFEFAPLHAAIDVAAEEYSLHDFTLEDIGKVALVADALPNIDFVSTPGVIKPSAVNPVEIADQRAFFEMVTHTTMRHPLA